MAEEIEVLEPQNDLEEETPEVEEPELTAEQIAELKRNAEVSSQNFERAKKAEAKAKALEDEKRELLERLGDSGEADDDIHLQLKSISSELASLKEEKQLDSVLNKWPVLKDKLSEFNEFRGDPENQGLKVETAAKAFLIEKDLLGEIPKRKGLEKAGGGQKVAPKAGSMSSDDVKRLRETNYEEYRRQLKAGKIKID